MTTTKDQRRQRPQEGARESRQERDILPVEEGRFEEEMKESGEKTILRVRPNRKAALVDFLVMTSILLAVGFGLHHWLTTGPLRYSQYAYKNLLFALKFAPAILGGVLSIRRLYPKFTTRFELTRRYILSELFVGVRLVDTADMSSVQDVQMMDMGFASNVIIYTKDKTTPIIRMDYLSRADGEAVVAFVRAHALGNLTEVYQARLTRQGRSRSDRGDRGRSGDVRARDVDAHGDEGGAQ